MRRGRRRNLLPPLPLPPPLLLLAVEVQLVVRMLDNSRTKLAEVSQAAMQATHTQQQQRMVQLQGVAGEALKHPTATTAAQPARLRGGTPHQLQAGWVVPPQQLLQVAYQRS